MSERTNRGCLRQGCFGCLGCGAIVIGLILLLGVIGFLIRRGEPSRESVGTEQVLPHLPGPADAPTTPSIPGQIPAPETPTAATALAQGDQVPAASGRIELDLSQCSFTLVPAAPGSGIRLHGDYDTARYVLDEQLESDSDTGWTYRLRLRARGMGWSSWFRQSSNANRLRLEVPRDRLVALSGRLALGESKLELGGLALSDLDLDFGIGGHSIHFGEPLAAPLESLRVVGSIGEMTLHGVGNASPRRVEVEHRIGEMLLDLSGVWSRDAEITARCGIGECRVVVPDDVYFEIRRSRGPSIGEGELFDPASPPEPPPGAPTLRLDVSHRVGGLYVGR